MTKKIVKKIKKYGSSFIVTLTLEERTILGVGLGDLVLIQQYTEEEKKEEEPNDLNTYEK